MSSVIVIDQGTHASRCLVFSHSGRVLARALRPVTLSRPAAGRATQDADELLNTVNQSIQDAVSQLGHKARGDLSCCGIITQRSSVLAWDSDGTPCSPVIGWQDTRGAGQIRALSARAKEIRRISGLPLSAHYGASKLHWLHARQTNHQQLHLGGIASFLLYSLSQSRNLAVDYCNAQRTQLFDIQNLAWSETLGDIFQVPLQILPQCHPVQHPYGVLTSTGVPITAMSGDQNSAWMANGEPEPGTALVNLGTGAFILAAGEASDTADGRLLNTLGRSDADQCDHLVEGTVNGAGSALTWLAGRYQSVDPAKQLSQWLDEVSEPPLFINTVGGLGSPWWSEGPAPGFPNESAWPAEAEAMCGAIESTLFMLRYNLELMTPSAPINNISVSGGLSNIDPLCQRLANLTGSDVIRHQEREASARGIAWLAAGRPAGWQSSPVDRHFRARPDVDLDRRYHQYLDTLHALIEIETENGTLTER